MLFSDLLAALYGRPPVGMPLGGPLTGMNPLPKAQTNATGASIPAVRGPALSSPSEMVDAGTRSLTGLSESLLRAVQTKQLEAQTDLLKQAGQPAPPMFLPDGGSSPSGGTDLPSGSGSLSMAPSAAESP